ncbi:MAG: hypothetical protein P8J33_13990 [Pirellulaceae bacterium]|nr:hypothetical protein [Pirellulaceae bacterium]
MSRVRSVMVIRPDLRAADAFLDKNRNSPYFGVAIGQHPLQAR